MKPIFLFSALISYISVHAVEYKSYSTVLKNGMKVIVCEKPDVHFTEFEVWYKTGSKDEVPGIRGMAHMFEHMMFRGTKKFPGNSIFDNVDKYGGSCNAYTDYDRTVYHEYVPEDALETVFDMESDRMANLVISQEILDTERQVVGEEFRNGVNNWYQKLDLERSKLLYPTGHPYEVSVIGYLEEITQFTSKQCQDFYDKYYSPNNAYLVIVGNVKSQAMFDLAEKYFGKVTKQLDLKVRTDVPDIISNKLKAPELNLDYPIPVQVFSYILPQPSAGSTEYYAFHMFKNLLFVGENSILQSRLVKKDHQAYAIQLASEDESMYSNYCIMDIIMQAFPGNARVKKVIREEIDRIATDGVSQDLMNQFITSTEATEMMNSYSPETIAQQLGIAEYYLHDYNKAYSEVDELKKITVADLKNVATKYFSTERIQVLNVKPM